MPEPLSAGSLLAHYEIVSRLGAGGMGEVYLASDRVLGRRVAIKVLSDAFADDGTARERFLREARSAAGLTHPNVCAVYEVGESEGRIFIAMQYVEGETVAERIARQGRLAVAEVVAVAADAARALAEAHAMSLVHRDVKPHNIMIDRRGYAVMLDFGLAKLARRVDDATDLLLTATGIVSGTVPYMAPEQLLGEEVDGRADIFGLGVVMYEALTGRRPFDGPTAAAVIGAILGQDPTPPGDGAEPGFAGLGAIISRCLAKRRDERYATAGELAADLAGLGSGAPSGFGASLGVARPAVDHDAPTTVGPRLASLTHQQAARPAPRRRSRRRALDSLAVLPFETASAGGEADLLGEGLTDSLIRALSRLPDLRVMARTTVSRFRGSDRTAAEIGDELGVRAVLSGSVQAHGDRYVVRAELVDVADGSVAWSERYTRRAADLIEMQEEIAREIASTLRPRLSAADRKRVVERPTRDPAAYQHYVRGTHFLNRRDVESMRKATVAFQAAIDTDPTFAAPYCGLAETYVYFGFLEMQRPREVFPAARAAALRALELDASFAEAHAALGWMKVIHEWDWAGAEDELAEAARLNPSCAMAHHWHGLLLSYLRRFEEALPRILLAQELDPLAPIVNTLVGTLASHRGDHDEALRVFGQVEAMAPGFVPLHLYRGLALRASGRVEEAAASFAAGLEHAPGEPLLLAAIGNAYGLLERTAEARAAVGRLEEQRATTYASAYGIALIWAGIGDHELAYRWLDEAYDERAAWLCTLQVDSRWDDFRREPRFRELVARIGFPSRDQPAGPATRSA